MADSSCIDFEAFTAPDPSAFDARAFVVAHRRRLPMSELRQGLKDHLEKVRQELVALINDNYSDFINLSSEMSGLEGKLEALKGPLADCESYAEGFRGELKGILDEARALFAEKERVSDERAFVERWLTNEALIDEIEKHLKRDHHHKHTGDFLSRYILYENLAIDIRRVQYNLIDLDLPSATTTDTATDTATAITTHKHTNTGAATAADSTATPPPPRSPPPPPPRSDRFALLLSRLDALLDTLGTQLAKELKKLLLRLARRHYQHHQFLSSRGSYTEGSTSGLGVQVGRGTTLSSMSAAGTDEGEDSGRGGRGAEALAVSHICRACMAIDRSDTVIKAFCDVFVDAAIEQALRDSERRSAGPGVDSDAGDTTARREAERLQQFLAAVEATLLSDASAFCTLLRSLSSRHIPQFVPTFVPSLHLLTEALAQPLLGRIETTFPSIFMPAYPQIFVVNYTALQGFLRGLERRVTKGEVMAFRRSEAYVRFQKKWKLQVYFSIKQKEHLAALEAILAKRCTLDQRTMHNDQMYWMAGSVAVLQQIEAVWHPHSYLHVMFDRALRFTAELLARYAAYVEAFLKALQHHDDTHTHTQTHTATTTTTTSAAERDEDVTVWRSGQPPVSYHEIGKVVSDLLTVVRAISTDPTRPKLDEWREGCVPEGGGFAVGRVLQLIFARVEAARREDEDVTNNGTINGSPVALEAGRLAARVSVPVKLQLVIQDFFDHSTQQLLAVKTRLVECLVGCLRSAACGSLAALRGIPAVYRMTNKPAPSRPSSYVEGVLKPLTSFADTSQTVVAKPLMSEWLGQAVEAIAMSYEQQVTSLMRTVEQQEKSLKKFQKKGGASDAGSQLTDLEKIFLQLKLDVEDFERQCGAKLGLVCDAVNTPALTRLVKMMGDAVTTGSALPHQAT
ncbi:unnamed protein product [Vitrella brassicaformis CCMP3155]|uniref:Conserved oligomeric Golgi complex subunit 2 n=3 Tax=Vitrella brassicaformis TaxID=1169539 RepID=A0A0G4EKB3_VITBC|nr:unnamed protein product [Vitrella brassicaformis CCMP3155]|eukprot:CEL97000.1 unnamed protein product [Vitrella brassicaformis CCMP3155]